MGSPQTKLKPKPNPESFDAFQWRGETPGLHHPGVNPVLMGIVDNMMAFEEWVEEHLPKHKKRFTYKGSNLIYDTSWGDITIKPSFWIVLIPNEYDVLEVNVMTNEQIESFYVHADH